MADVGKCAVSGDESTGGSVAVWFPYNAIVPLFSILSAALILHLPKPIRLCAFTVNDFSANDVVSGEPMPFPSSRSFPPAAVSIVTSAVEPICAGT